MTKFQTIIIVIFVVLIIGGLAAFATYKSSSVNLKDIKVTIWGTIPKAVFEKYTLDPGRSSKDSYQITYVEYQEPVFTQKLVEALARGAGPDALLISEESLLRNKDKLYPIPYKTYTERTFRDTFVQAGEVFLDQTGVLGLPFAIDPLVLYWNRDSFTTAGITEVPRYWDEYLTLAPKLVKKDEAGNLLKVALPFGEYANVSNASSILSLLFMQAGARMTTTRPDGTLQFSLSAADSGKSPASSALRFYTDFANPSKSFYSWNRALPSSENMFVAGDAASYVGFASNLASIRAKNPNLNFDLAVVPQSRVGLPMTFGHVYAFTLLKASKNLSGAYAVITSMTSAFEEATFANVSSLAPARRDLLAATEEKAFPAIIHASAVLAKTWPNPNPQNVGAIYKSVIESITTGRVQLGSAAISLDTQIQSEIDILNEE